MPFATPLRYHAVHGGTGHDAGSDVPCVLINSFAYMPTLGLINTISYIACKMPGWISLLTSRQSVSGHHRLYHGNVGGEPVWLRIKHMQLYIGAALSAILVLFTLTCRIFRLLNSKRIRAGQPCWARCIRAV